MGAIEKVLPLLARSNDDIAKETLAFLSILLFNANKDVQVRTVEVQQFPAIYFFDYYGIIILVHHV